MADIPWSLINTVLNVVVVIGGGVVGFYLRGVKESIAKLESTDGELAKKISAIEVMVAGQYVTRQEFQHVIEKLGEGIFKRLDAISVKLDSKADKL